MKRYDGYILRFINHEGGATQQEPAEVYLASEVDETIMNMVDEFAETAKDYEADRAKDKEEINRLKLDNGILVDWCKEKDSEIMRLKIEQTGDFATTCLKTKIQKQRDQLYVAKKALGDIVDFQPGKYDKYDLVWAEMYRIARSALAHIAELERE